ncbi:MAG: DUF724 domain-containing protein [archaeon]|nr:DUF724 domain-containing protein [archaeon]
MKFELNTSDAILNPRKNKSLNKNKPGSYLKRPYYSINIRNRYSIPVNNFLSNSKSKRKRESYSVNCSSYLKRKHNFTSTNSPTKPSDDYVKLKEITIKKDMEISKLKKQVKEKDKLIKELQEEIVFLKKSKKEVNENEIYEKKVLLRNIRTLTADNESLRQEIKQGKEKETKIMKLLFNLSKKGIPIEEMINCAEENISESDDLLNDEEDNEQQDEQSGEICNTSFDNSSNSESLLTNGTFIPLYFENQNHTTEGNAFSSSIGEKNIVPKLNFQKVNQNFNDCYESPQVNQNQIHHHKGKSNQHLKGKTEINPKNINNENNTSSSQNSQEHPKGKTRNNKNQNLKGKIGNLKPNIFLNKSNINLSLLSNGKKSKNYQSRTAVTEVNINLQRDLPIKENAKSRVELMLKPNKKILHNKSFKV